MRTWIFDALGAIPDIETDAPGGIHQASSLDGSVPEQKPFILFRVGAKTSELEDDEVALALNSLVTIWVHGIPGDYDPIDKLLEKIRLQLSGSGNSIISCRFITESDDLRDPEMGTIMRYTRFQLIHTPEEA